LFVSNKKITKYEILFSFSIIYLYLRMLTSVTNSTSASGSGTSLSPSSLEAYDDTNVTLPLLEGDDDDGANSYAPSLEGYDDDSLSGSELQEVEDVSRSHSRSHSHSCSNTTSTFGDGDVPMIRVFFSGCRRHHRLHQE
jgi:hypothetical protein